ncbi:hypothetical protein [Luteococcus peritonei]|uniref:PH domain-containing protein n=1 Tax=Luteococcus peritonei TaxID=88874 RepID=A0ABW4RYF1_9ACTN
MYLPDSTREPVEIRGDVPAGADLRLLAILVAGVALAVPISLFWHPVAWWGWVGAVALALGAGLALSVPASARETCRLVGDAIELTRGDQVRRISAREVATLSSPADLPLRSALKLVTGEVVLLNHRELWGETAYPVPRVLANWIQQHGGGQGGETPRPWRAPTPAPPLLVRLVRSLPFYVVLTLALWLFAVLAICAVAGYDRPDFTRGWMMPAVMLMGRLVSGRGGNKEWTRDPATW